MRQISLTDYFCKGLGLFIEVLFEKSLFIRFLNTVIP